MFPSTKLFIFWSIIRLPGVTVTNTLKSRFNTVIVLIH